ncbi:hypothetical protein CEK28_17830 [Xenophilus sp. AP218F]|nr:PilZ domain-containing protein [Chromobacterium sp. ASV5]OWY37260.1 hypothetical protein CEK28_17830 [Xenophilus sp. AP218F]
MSPLPDLDTVSFDARLPFSAQPLADEPLPPLSRETRLALKVLAAPTETPDDASPILTRLEAKIDLALEVSLLERHPERPPLTRCRLGLEAVAWLDARDWPAGAAALLTLYPNPDSALGVFLPARVLSSAPAQDGRFLVRADVRGALDDDTQLQWEKWVFRRHRRAIQER